MTLLQLYKDKLSGIVSDEQFKILSGSFNSELSNYNERLELIEKECIGLINRKENYTQSGNDIRKI